MNLKKLSSLFVLFIAVCVTPGFGQIFWSNYSPSGLTDNIWCVTYANNTFAAVTDQGSLLTSTDGLNWSRQTIDQGVWLVSIAYGNGTWVVVGDKGAILISSDLKTWVSEKAITSNKLNGVFYDGSVWAAVGEAGTIITSSDAQNWISQPTVSGVTGFLHGITTIQIDTGVVGFSSTPGFLVCGANGVLLGGQAGGSNFTPINFTSVPITQNLESVLSIPELNTTIAVGWNGTILQVPSAFGGLLGGLSPSPSIIPKVIFRGLTYGNGIVVAAGEQGTIMSSTDGANWTQRFSGDSPSTPSTATLLSAAYSSRLQRFVVTGTAGTILVSNPPPTILANVSTRGYVSSTETFIGGFVIEGTAPRTVLIRGDGPVLSTFGVPGPLSDPVLTVYDNNGKVIATNTGWTTNSSPQTLITTAVEVGAFALPNPSADSALLLTLHPGAYTVQITSAKGNSGITLFEAYTD